MVLDTEESWKKIHLIAKQGHERLAQHLGIEILLHRFLTPEFWKLIGYDLNPQIAIRDLAAKIKLELIYQSSADNEFELTTEDVLLSWLVMATTQGKFVKPESPKASAKEQEQ